MQVIHCVEGEIKHYHAVNLWNIQSSCPDIRAHQNAIVVEIVSLFRSVACNSSKLLQVFRSSSAIQLTMVSKRFDAGFGEGILHGSDGSCRITENNCRLRPLGSNHIEKETDLVSLPNIDKYLLKARNGLVQSGSRNNFHRWKLQFGICSRPLLISSSAGLATMESFRSHYQFRCFGIFTQQFLNALCHSRRSHQDLRGILLQW
mmetsp:Transcript_9305/g.23136  ORF Transcript_9305/g.23136 Transcript_9305/m.23136 type:complete len:204 (-) Transcript_9305:1146-1757(-)